MRCIKFSSRFGSARSKSCPFRYRWTFGWSATLLNRTKEINAVWCGSALFKVTKGLQQNLKDWSLNSLHQWMTSLDGLQQHVFENKHSCTHGRGWKRCAADPWSEGINKCSPWCRLIPNSQLYLIDLKNICGFSFLNVKFKALCIYCHLGFRLLVVGKRTDVKHRNHSRLWALFIMPLFLKD